jgi:hypothetical protein
LEGKPTSARGGARDGNNFAGTWSWAGKKLEFADGGIVKVNKAAAGKWMWAKSNAKSLIAFVLDTDNTAAMARLSKTKEGVLRVMPLNGKETEARREP